MDTEVFRNNPAFPDAVAVAKAQGFEGKDAAFFAMGLLYARDPDSVKIQAGNHSKSDSTTDAGVHGSVQSILSAYKKIGGRTLAKGGTQSKGENP